MDSRLTTQVGVLGGVATLGLMAFAQTIILMQNAVDEQSRLSTDWATALIPTWISIFVSAPLVGLAVFHTLTSKPSTAPPPADDGSSKEADASTPSPPKPASTTTESNADNNTTAAAGSDVESGQPSAPPSLPATAKPAFPPPNLVWAALLVNEYVWMVFSLGLVAPYMDDSPSLSLTWARVAAPVLVGCVVAILLAVAFPPRRFILAGLKVWAIITIAIVVARADRVNSWKWGNTLAPVWISFIAGAAALGYAGLTLVRAVDGPPIRNTGIFLGLAGWTWFAWLLFCILWVGWMDDAFDVAGGVDGATSPMLLWELSVIAVSLGLAGEAFLASRADRDSLVDGLIDVVLALAPFTPPGDTPMETSFSQDREQGGEEPKSEVVVVESGGPEIPPMAVLKELEQEPFYIELVAEKHALQETLLAFRAEFKAEHGRDVSSVSDRAPVEDTYQAYQSAKSAITVVEDAYAQFRLSGDPSQYEAIRSLYLVEIPSSDLDDSCPYSYEYE